MKTVSWEFDEIFQHFVELIILFVMIQKIRISKT